MLKKRIVPIQLLLNKRLVKSRQFGDYRDVGNPVQSSGVYNSQTADELILLNIDNTATDVEALIEVMAELHKVCFMPLSVGGGIRTLSDVDQLILSGADKVVLNSICYKTPELVTTIANKYGTQAVVCMVDVRFDRVTRQYQLFSNAGQTPHKISLEDHIKRLELAGAGELVIQSIDNDGMMAGYDVDLISAAMKCTALPVLCAGGAGNYEHLRAVIDQTDVSAVVCGSLFNFTDSNPLRAKAFLQNHNIKFKVV